MLELVVRSRLGRDGIIRTSSSLVTHKNFLGRYSSKVEQLYVAQYIPVQLRISSLYSKVII
jgi:hypothetical protein